MNPTRVVALLSSCLVLVRTAGMSNAEAEDWLTIAARELQDVPADLLEEGCSQARRTCIHHGRILPTIWGHIEERWNERKRRRFTLLEAPQPKRPTIEPQPWTPAPGELEQIKRAAAAQLRADEGTPDKGGRHGGQA